MTPPAPRALFRPGPEGLEVVIPAVRNVVLLVFLGGWLIAWLFGELTALAAFAGLLASQPSPGQAFLGFWLIFWTLGGGCAALVWLWTLGGAERLPMGSSVLTLHWRVFGVGPAWGYERHRIYNLRVMSGQSAPPMRTGPSCRACVRGGSGSTTTAELSVLGQDFLSRKPDPWWIA